MVYTFLVNSVFEVLAEPNRRAILRSLLESEHSVGELQRALDRPQPTVSKHLRVLRETGFVESRTVAQRRVYRLRTEPFADLESWLQPFRRLWTKHLDALEHHLDRTSRRTTRKKRGAKP